MNGLWKLFAARLLAVAMAVAATLVEAQSGPPPSPPLTEAQATQVRDAMEGYRHEVEARVARGDITPAEAERLTAWREWQIARQVAGMAPPPAIGGGIAANPSPFPPAPGYPPYVVSPYVAPGFAAPPVFWGFSICAGRAFHNGWGSFCI